MSEIANPAIKKIPYRPITLLKLGELIDKCQYKSGYEMACYLMADNGLLILQKEGDGEIDTTNVTDINEPTGTTNQVPQND